MSSSVNVLAPNGRRQIVKCTPNTTILQIIEEVCKKQGFDAESYDVKHHNKVLDTTTTFRFSGLPNNAQLELCEATKLRTDSDVTLAINLENGSRVMGNVKPSDTLLEVLKQLCPDCVEHGKSPVVIYTRREIYGDDLEKITLKSLGLTGGRAMIRLINRSPEELKTQANVSAPLPVKPVEEKPFVRKIIRDEPKVQPKEQSPEKIVPDEQNPENSGNNLDFKAQKNTSNKVDILKLAREKRKQEISSSPVIEEKRKVDRNSEPTPLSKPPHSSLCPCKKNSIQSDCEQSCKERCSEKDKQPTKEEFMFLGTRNAMLFSLESANAIPSEDLPDDFFDLTIDDAKRLLRDVRKMKNGMDNSPLMTSQLRQLEESKKQMRHLNKYKKAIIRIQFPDRTVLQGTFKPTDSVRDVLDFTREYIEDKSLDFYVYSTPPKTILNPEKVLVEINCVPGALLHFGTNETTKKIHYLRSDLSHKFTSASKASLAANKMRCEGTRTNCQLEDDTEMDYEESTAPNSQNDPGPSTSSGITQENYERKYDIPKSKDVPKWFKPQ